MKDNDSSKNDDIIRFIGKKWVLPILKEFEKEATVRFNQLKQSFEITSTTLSIILKKLERNHIIKKKIYHEFPIRTEYSLTKKGKKIINFIKELDRLSNNSDTNNHISHEEKKINRDWVTLAVETALLEMAPIVLDKVEFRLKNDYGCVIGDCLEHPEYLKIILCDLFGESYADILDTIQRVLKSAQAEKKLEHFVYVLKSK